jgi:chromate reductase
VWTGLETLPPYDADVDGRFAEPAVARLRRTIATANAVVMATPEYNASIPGPLKIALPSRGSMSRTISRTTDRGV